MTREEEIRQAQVAIYGTENCRAAEHFAHGASWADTHPHWISVEDELPPREKDVLIWSSGWNKAMIGYYKNWNWQRKTNVFHSYVDNGTWFNITHWMPIPQPPKP